MRSLFGFGYMGHKIQDTNLIRLGPHPSHFPSLVRCLVCKPEHRLDPNRTQTYRTKALPKCSLAWDPECQQTSNQLVTQRTRPDKNPSADPLLDPSMAQAWLIIGFG